MIQQYVNFNDIKTWLINKVADMSNSESSTIDAYAPLANYDLDSIHAVSLTGDLEDWLNIELEPTIIWDYPTINELATYVSELVKVDEPKLIPQVA